jgi:orotate phosphoribosyltransferase
MERGRSEHSAVQELTREFGLPVIAIATLEDLLAFLAGRPELKAQAAEVRAYRERYGAAV